MGIEIITRQKAVELIAESMGVLKDGECMDCNLSAILDKLEPGKGYRVDGDCGEGDTITSDNTMDFLYGLEESGNYYNDPEYIKATMASFVEQAMEEYARLGLWPSLNATVDTANPDWPSKGIVAPITLGYKDMVGPMQNGEYLISSDLARRLNILPMGEVVGNPPEIEIAPAQEVQLQSE